MSVGYFPVKHPVHNDWLSSASFRPSMVLEYDSVHAKNFCNLVIGAIVCHQFFGAWEIDAVVAWTDERRARRQKNNFLRAGPDELV